MADDCAAAPTQTPVGNTSGRTVKCVKFGKDLPGLDVQPWPGELGTRIFENVSAQAWKLWEERQKMILNVGERNFELHYLKNVHSEADTAIWLPKERVLFSAAVAGIKRFSNIRPNVQIPDMLSAMKMMKALNPEIVVPGHGAPGTTKIFDDSIQYYSLLLERVGKMVKDGKSLETIKTELRMPETDDWASKERIDTNIEAAYLAVKGN